jgi:hypothetical protein
MKKVTVVLVFTIAAIFMIFSCSKKSTENDEIIAIEDLLVKNNEITGWSYSGTGWTADNLDELIAKINGDADKYGQHGFVQATFQAYQGTIDNRTCELATTIHDLGTEANAMAAYNDPNIQLSGGIDWDGGAGTEASYIRYGLSQALAFYHKSYYVYLNLNYDTEESLNILKTFALNISGKID